jgi:hypothetical protein
MNSRQSAKALRGRRDTALGLVKAFLSSNQAFDLSNVLEQDPNTLQDNLKNAFKDELGIDENWVPRDGVYVGRRKNEEDAAIKLSIARAVRGGLIGSEAILKARCCIYSARPLWQRRPLFAQGRAVATA